MGGHSIGTGSVEGGDVAASGADARPGGSVAPRGRGCAGRLVAVLFGLIFAGLGLFFLLLLGGTIWASAQTHWWKRVPCTIVESRVVTDDRPGEQQPYRPVVRYRYAAADGQRTSDAIRQTNPTFSSYANAQAVARRYPAGTTTTCFVDPAHPGRSVLEHDSLWVALMLVVPLILFVFGGAVLWSAFRNGGAASVATATATTATASGSAGDVAGADPSTAPGRALRAGGFRFKTPRASSAPPPQQQRPQRAISERSRSATFGALLLFGIFMLVGVGVSFPTLILPARRISNARSWPAVPCTIVSSRVQEHRGSKGSRTYSADILYRYTFNGHEYRSNQFGAANYSTSDRDGVAAEVRRFRPHGKATCYVNPADPADAMLDRARHGSMTLIAIIPVAFFLVGAGGLFFTWRAARRRRWRALADGSAPLSPIRSISRAATRRFGPATAARSTISTPREESLGGPVTLRPRFGPGKRIILAASIALFWNGIVSIFLVLVVQQWSSGHGEVFETLFLIPFVLIGIGFIAWLGYSILALFNPRPELTLDHAAVPLGGTAHVGWRFAGRYDRIGRLRVTLEGREEATYRRGTDTHTDRRVFFRHTLADVTRPMDIASGRATVTVPPNTMHSFSAPHNKIVWELKLHGDIQGWPDVDESFALDVLPLPAREG
jgi:hypothetical protein